MNTNRRYILDGKKAVPCIDLLEWGRWFETNNRRVALAEKNGVKVSTVFLGLDHGFSDKEPLLFETMIFGGKHDGYQKQYKTWDEAENGHKVALDLIASEEIKP